MCKKLYSNKDGLEKTDFTECITPALGYTVPYDRLSTRPELKFRGAVRPSVAAAHGGFQEGCRAAQGRVSGRAVGGRKQK